MFALKGAPLSTRIRYHRFGHIACETYKIHKNLSTPPLGKQNGGVRSNTTVLVTYLHVFKIFRRFPKAIGIFVKSDIFQRGHFPSKTHQKRCTLRFLSYFRAQHDTDSSERSIIPIFKNFIFQRGHFSSKITNL